jgi:hypothetical protein
MQSKPSGQSSAMQSWPIGVALSTAGTQASVVPVGSPVVDPEPPLLPELPDSPLEESLPGVPELDDVSPVSPVEPVSLPEADIVALVDGLSVVGVSVVVGVPDVPADVSVVPEVSSPQPSPSTPNARVKQSPYRMWPA